jgi:integrase
MKDENKLPLGIRATPPLNDGTVNYEARVNRNGVKMSRRWTTIKDAAAWKAQMDVLIENGVDPRELENSKARERIVPANPPTRTLTPSPPAPDIADVAPTARADMTVGQAIDEYLAHRSASHIKLKPNQITEYERVRDDLGSLKVANLVNKDLANYITLLLSTPRKRDDPALASTRKTAVAPKADLSAKARANAKYKAKVRAKVKAEKSLKEAKPLAGATVRKYILAMQTAIKWQSKNNAVEYHRFLFDFDNNTLPPAWGGRRDRRLFAGEEARLYAAGIDRGDYTYTSQDWSMLIGFALETAMRQQELALAKWDDQREDGAKLFIPKENSKTNKDRSILLSGRARAIIEFQRSTCPKGAARIFHQFPNAQSMCDSYARLTKRAGTKDLTFHDLRHEATSRLCERGEMSLMEIMEMTGHDTMLTFKGYVKLIAHENGRRLK